MFKSITVLIFFNLILFSYLGACSRVFYNNKNEKIVIRSMDLNRSDRAKIVILPKGIEKKGYPSNGLQWVAKYGSIVTTAFDNATTDGINECGLAAHIHYSKETKYLSSPLLPKIGIHLWIQYFLDCCKNVQEVIQLASTIQVVNEEIDNEFWPLFAILEDATGNSAILEYINGKLVAHCSNSYNVATNDPFYSVQLQNLAKYRGFGGSSSLPCLQDSESRFVRLSALLNQKFFHWRDLFAIIKKNSYDDWQTLWISIADVKNKHYTFIRASDNQEWFFDLNKIDFSEEYTIIDPLKEPSTHFLNQH